MGLFESFPVVHEGPIEVSGKFLRTPILACGAIHRFDISEGRLPLGTGGSEATVYERAE